MLSYEHFHVMTLSLTILSLKTRELSSTIIKLWGAASDLKGSEGQKWENLTLTRHC